MEGETLADRPTPAASPWPQRGRRVALGLVFAVAAVLGWFILAVLAAGISIKVQAGKAQDSVETVKSELLAGDFAAAKESAADARSQVASAADSANAPALLLAARAPAVQDALDDLDHLIDAAGDLAAASDQLVDIYGAAAGKGPEGGGLFTDGRVDFGALERTRVSVGQTMVLVRSAETSLHEVDGTSPGGSTMTSARDSALGQVTPLIDTLESFSTVLTRMPSALGKGGSKTYLLVTHNPAELYPGGGAALSAALVRFTDGALSIPLKGTVSTKLFPNNPRYQWKHDFYLPYYDSKGNGAAFAFSDLHPDFDITAADMEKSWITNGQAPVDGVITLDPTALSAALRVTGPIPAPGYGEINADNLVQKLLIDGYANFSEDQEARHRLNESLMTTVFAKLSSGDGALSLVQALASTAPGHHFRVHVDDPVLQSLVTKAGLAGEFPKARGDLLAVFSENQNGSKVDIFQKRTVTHDVVVAEDGSASVTTTLRAAYEVPSNGPQTSERIGYLTDWSDNWYLAHLPGEAEQIRISAPRRDPEDRDDPTVYPDADGRQIVRVGRWTAAGDATLVTLTYRYPAGTFGNNSALDYQLDLVPQPMTQEATVTITVTGPGAATVTSDAGDWQVDGGVARLSGPFAQVSSTQISWR